MLFLTYWELNENMAIAERVQIAHTLTASGVFPPPGVTILRWDSTPDGWGILLVEADSAAAMHQALTLWRAAGAGFFQLTKTSSALPVQEAIALTSELLKGLGGP